MTRQPSGFGVSARSLVVGASILSGIAWLAWELSRRFWDDGASSDCSTSADFYNDAMFALATIAGAVALGSLSRSLRGAPRWFSLAAAVGVAAGGIGNSVEHCLAEPFFLVFAAGLLVYVLASCALGATLVVTAQLGRWPGLLLSAAALGLNLSFERGGAAVTGFAWLLFGVLFAVMASRERMANEN
jgi:hypothetical protein